MFPADDINKSNEDNTTSRFKDGFKTFIKLFFIRYSQLFPLIYDQTQFFCADFKIFDSQHVLGFALNLSNGLFFANHEVNIFHIWPHNLTNYFLHALEKLWDDRGLFEDRVTIV